MLKFNKNKGFTLIETIIAIFVVTVGVLAAYTVIQQIIVYNRQIEDRLTAVYLAKEGIEIVRNIRDTNWLQNAKPDPAPPEDWDAGLLCSSSPCEWEADYNTTTFTGSGNYDTNCNLVFNCNQCSPSCEIENLIFLKVERDFYKYSFFGTETKFKRKITITPDGTDKLEVTVSVWWREKGNTYNKEPITAQEILYDWY